VHRDGAAGRRRQRRERVEGTLPRRLLRPRRLAAGDGSAVNLLRVAHPHPAAREGREVVIGGAEAQDEADAEVQEVGVELYLGGRLRTELRR
jgi:hypothetical protein